MRNKLLLGILFIFLLSSCNKDKEVIRSFCYWKTNLNFRNESDSLIKKMNVKHMYVRFFDVAWSKNDNEPVPVANIQSINLGKSKLELTPSIFITNEVFLNTNKKQLDSLAIRIVRRVEDIAENKVYNRTDKAFYPEVNFKDILIDCDWSPKSKDNYFYLLEQIKKNRPSIKISATIRLWQYKYATKAGTPPVDKGLLMCYNITKPNDFKTENSIGTSTELGQYITHNKYKLKLDITLPLYSWAVIFRGNQYKGILSDYDKLINDSVKLREESSNKYVLKEDILIGKNYLRNGDIIRIEKISDEELDKMISIIKRKIEVDNQTRISFFSFDKKFINNHGVEKISKYYARF